MSETIPGGVYENADGKGYHDAHGNPVKGAVADKAEAQAEKDQAEADKAFRTMTGQEPAKKAAKK